MQVRDFMSAEVHTLEESVLCVDAYRMFRERRVRRAPVVRGSEVIGIVSDRDLLRVLPWSIGDAKDEEADFTTTVGEVVSRRVLSVRSDEPAARAAELMLEHRVGGLPVIDDGALVGIITETDILRGFVQLAPQPR